MKNPSAVKRHKQSEVRRIKNHAVKSAVRTIAKKYTEAVRTGAVDTASIILKELCSKLDSAARKGIIAKNTAARKKSRMQILYNNTFIKK